MHKFERYKQLNQWEADQKSTSVVLPQLGQGLPSFGDPASPIYRSREGSQEHSDRLTALTREKPLTEEEMNLSRTTFYENLKRVPSVVIPSDKEMDRAVTLGMQPFSLVDAQVLLNKRQHKRER